jgi:hypothetical protein
MSSYIIEEPKIDENIILRLNTFDNKLIELFYHILTNTIREMSNKDTFLFTQDEISIIQSIDILWELLPNHSTNSFEFYMGIIKFLFYVQRQRQWRLNEFEKKMSQNETDFEDIQYPTDIE